MIINETIYRNLNIPGIPYKIGIIKNRIGYTAFMKTIIVKGNTIKESIENLKINYDKILENEKEEIS